MKKSTLTTCILCLTLGILVGVVFSEKRTQEAVATEDIYIKISPNTIVIGSETEWVTVHTNIPLSRVDCSTLTLNDIGVAWTKSDAKGYLVAKFNYEAVEKIVSPPQATLTLEGVTKDGISFSGSDTVVVRESGPEN